MSLKKKIGSLFCLCFSHWCMWLVSL